MKASLESVTAAAASSPKMPADFRVSITNAPGKDAYPISSFTWLLIPQQSKDAVKGKILADFLNWMVTDGQKMTSALSLCSVAGKRCPKRERGNQAGQIDPGTSFIPS